MRWKLLSALLFAACFALPAAAEKRVALVIGNSAYQSVPRLENPGNDAQLVAETLQRLGFTLSAAAPRSTSTRPPSTARSSASAAS